MAQTTFTDNVFVDGSQDIKQLRVQGHTTQTQALQTWENSAGTVQGQVTGDGRLLLGDDVGLSSPDALMEAHRLETSTAKPKRGFHSLGRVSDTLTNIAQWIVQELEIRGTGNISALQTALRVRASNMNTGTPAAGAEVRAADFEVINDAAAGAAALPIATGLQVAVTNAASKTITQAFGLHVKMNNSGTITTPYAIFTEGAGVTHLEDYVEVKRPVATPGTPATDFIRVYPKPDGNLYAKNWSGVETQLGGGTSFSNQSANTVFAGPSSGAAAVPAFRALVANDIPALDAAKTATGVFNNARINWAAPSNLGATTPATGAFTTLTATSEVINGTAGAGYLELVDQTTIPATPATDRVRIYAKTDGKLYAKNWNGTEYDLTGTGIATIPTGAISSYAGSAAPTGWLICGGSAVSRTTYATLFGVIGTSFGAGDGSTTFNVPDLRGRLPLGADNMGGTSANRVTATQADNLGQGAGEENHTLTIAEMPAHSHSIGNPTNNYGGNNGSWYGNDISQTVNTQGGGGAHNNMPPYITLNYIIKT